MSSTVRRDKHKNTKRSKRKNSPEEKQTKTSRRSLSLPLPELNSLEKTLVINHRIEGGPNQAPPNSASTNPSAQ